MNSLSSWLFLIWQFSTKRILYVINIPTVKNQPLYDAHIDVLTQKSDYFVAMFRSNMRDSIERVVQVSNCSKAAVLCVLEYLSLDDFTVHIDDVALSSHIRTVRSLLTKTVLSNISPIKNLLRDYLRIWYQEIQTLGFDYQSLYSC